MAPPRAVFQFADACGGTFILTGTLDQISDVLRSMTCASIFATVETVLNPWIYSSTSRDPAVTTTLVRAGTGIAGTKGIVLPCHGGSTASHSQSHSIVKSLTYSHVMIM